MNGWWKFHRAMLDHPVWKLPHAQRSVWIVILTKVNHTNKDWFDGVQRVPLGPGEMITSQEHLAEMAGTTRQVVRDTLTALLRLGTIGTKIRTKRYTQITVVNWPLYQGEEVDENQEENHKRTKREPSENQARTIAGEGKNVRSKKPSVADAPDLPLGDTPQKPMTAHQAVIESYRWTFEREFHAKAMVNASEGKAAKDIAAGRTPEEAAWIPYEYLAHRTDKVKDNRWYSLRHVLMDCAKVLARSNPKHHPLPPELLRLIGGSNGLG